MTRYINSPSYRKAQRDDKIEAIAATIFLPGMVLLGVVLMWVLG